MTSRRRPPLVQTVGEERNLLVRVENETEAREVALAFLAADVEANDYLSDGGELSDGIEIAIRHVTPALTYRWVPSPPGDDWSHYLHPSRPGPGAFRARVVEWGYQAAKEALNA